jgi:acetylornithine deacetylase/succinyl-diaminopimelate desuccinylase-like protein
VRRLAAAAALALLVCAPASAADLRQQISDYRAAHEAAIIGQLDELVRLPSVEANPAGLGAVAARLESLLKARGFNAALLTAPGAPPVVFGTYNSPGARRTVVFYAHYDGQPVTPAQWNSDPFAPVMHEGAKVIEWKDARPPFNPEWRFFGRGTGDDKNSITAFLTAFDALKALGRKPSVNIKVFWEGEEERSSPHLAEILRGHRDALRADLWLIGDGPLHQSRTPTLYFGARGNLGLDATVYGPLRPLHDGHYGNWVPNPAVMAAELIASMRDSEGRILIPGFADDARPLTPAEKAAIARLPPVESDLRREFGIGRSEGSEGLTDSTMRPALNIRGFRSGQVGAEGTSSIPTDAMIAMGFRLVPGQTPQTAQTRVESFLRAKGWTIVTEAPDAAARAAHPRIIRLVWHDAYPALRSDMTSPAARGAIAAASAAAGKPVTILPMMGASVPIYMFDDILKAPVIGLPISNHDNNQHAANENLRLGNLWDGINLYAAMMAELNW